MSKLPDTINLLNPMNPPGDVFSVTFDWLSSVGRYFLIAMEVIVLIVFFTRFILDKKNHDLTDSINSKVAILAEPSLRKEEAYFVNINELLKDISKLSQNQVLNSVTVATLLDSIPADIRLTQFQFYEDTVTMSFIASSFESISNYEADLDSNPAYKNVTLNLDKENSDKNNVRFTVSFELVTNNE